jgi:hypothetical protein
MQYATTEKLARTTKIPDGQEPPNGMIVPGTGLNLKACIDGISKTLMVCETIEPAMTSWYDGTTSWTTALNPNSLATHPPKRGDDGIWQVPEGGSTALNVGPRSDKSIAYSPALEGYGFKPQVISWGPSSNHAGGVVNHLAVDGSIHALSDKIDPTLYMHLVTRAGGESDAMPRDFAPKLEK